MKRRQVALLDACVLIPMPLADTLLRLAEPPALFEARWTNDILAEVTRALEHRFGKSPEKARYREAAMREFFPGSLVHHYRRLIQEMENHPKDRHVLAAAVACHAEYLVTLNLKDFFQSSREVPGGGCRPFDFSEKTLEPRSIGCPGTVGGPSIGHRHFERRSSHSPRNVGSTIRESHSATLMRS